MSTARKLATYEDLLSLPEDVRAEIVGGEITSMPAPAPRHQRAQRTLGSLIGRPFDDDHGRGGPGGWWILPDVDVSFSAQHVYRPDLSGWRRERLPRPWDARPIDVVPDWICEVISPSNTAHDRVRKRRIYARFGVRHYWLVDPLARTLEALRLDGEVWTEIGTYGDGDVARIAPFDAVELEVSQLFPPDEPPVAVLEDP
jgi:Uma2 family endonuclease